MYHILESENGQPVILWQTKHDLYQYVLSRGRVFSKGVLRKDIHSNFSLWKTSPSYISYQSVDGSTVICELGIGKVTEIYITKETCTLVSFGNFLYIFSLTVCENHFQLYGRSSKNFSDAKFIADNLELTESLYASATPDSIVLHLHTKDIYVSEDFQIIKKMLKESFISSKITDNEKDFPEQKNDTIDSLTKEISRLKYALHTMEEKHHEFVNQYDQLYAYTGELQEKLRRYKLNQP